ncbi:MAG: putative secreted protein [Alphaproteobacteria bacterium]|nr:putative secreted protein [Alphaproteobacteria bacterium]
MRVMLKALVVSALLAGTAMAPAEAQQRHGTMVSRTQTSTVHYREIGVSRGHKWRKGQKLARNDRRYVVSDWNRRGLRAPPRGYQWVRENNNSGDYLLVAAATGLIASILAQ